MSTRLSSDAARGRAAARIAPPFGPSFWFVRSSERIGLWLSVVARAIADVDFSEASRNERSQMWAVASGCCLRGRWRWVLRAEWWVVGGWVAVVMMVLLLQLLLLLLMLLMLLLPAWAAAVDCDSGGASRHLSSSQSGSRSWSRNARPDFLEGAMHGHAKRSWGWWLREGRRLWEGGMVKRANSYTFHHDPLPDYGTLPDER